MAGHLSRLIACLCCAVRSPAEARETLHVITYSNRYSLKQIPMLLSAAKEGYAVRVLDGGGHSSDPGQFRISIWGRSLGAKLLAIRDFLKEVDDDDVVLFVDALDVLFVQPPRKLLEAYRALAARTGRQLFVAAEEGGGFRASDQPALEFRWRYMNSGALIGVASAWRVVFKDPPPSYLPARYVGDQDWLIDVYLNSSGLGGLMAYDSRCELFQVTCRVHPAATVDICPPSEDVSFDFQDGTVVNRVTGTHPSVLHLVGPAHWPIKYSAGLLGRERHCSCAYYEVARLLMPGEIRALELDRAFSGQPHSVICTDDALVLHVLLDGLIEGALLNLWFWLLALGLCALILRRRLFPVAQSAKVGALDHAHDV